MPISNKLKTPYKSWAIICLGLVLVILTPLFPILEGWTQSGDEVWIHILNFNLFEYTKNSLLLCFITLLLSTIFGILCGWYTSKYDFFGSKILRYALILPLTIPVYIMAYSYSDMLSHGGMLQAMNVDIVNVPGLSLIYAFSLFPYVYLAAFLAFTYSSEIYHESAISLGLSKRQTFWKVDLPLARPFIAGGLFLVAMEVLNDYGAVKYFGIPTFTYGIFRSWFSLESLNSALRLSSILLAVVFLIYFWEKWIQSKSAPIKPGETSNKKRTKLKRTEQIPVVIITWSVFGLSFALPVFKLLRDVVLNFELASVVSLKSAIANTIWLSLIISFLGCICAVLLTYNQRVNNGKIHFLFQKIGNLGYALPGAILAMGMLFLFNHEFSLPSWILSGSLILCLGLVIRFMAISIQPISSAIEKFPIAMDEAASGFGLKKLKILTNILFPNIRPALLAALILTFIDVMKELPLTLILRPFNFDTLATKTFELANDELIIESSFPSVILIFIGSIAIVFLREIYFKKLR